MKILGKVQGEYNISSTSANVRIVVGSSNRDFNHNFEITIFKTFHYK